MTTIAKPISVEGSHWYDRDGQPRHFVPKKDGSGNRPTTIRDARDNDWLPSVTTILKSLDKPALTNWLIEQAVLTVLTAPRKSDESLDAFIQRVLRDEKQQDAEGQAARDLGTDIHNAIELAVQGHEHDGRLSPFVCPVLESLRKFGRMIAVEKIVVSDSGFAGKVDYIGESDLITVVDFKTTKKLPKESWTEHKLQLAAYASTLGNTGDKRIQTANIYISTVEPGKLVVTINEDWQETFEGGFKPLLAYWQWANNWI